MRKVLIVEDSSSMALFIKKLVEKSGFETAGCAENGLMGVELYKKLRPDLVTMDIAMPSMDGIQSMKRILEFDPRAKVVVVSSIANEPTMNEAVFAGAQAFIAKPFKPDTLLHTLGTVSGLIHV